MSKSLSLYDAVEKRGFFFYSGANGALCRKQGLGGWRLSIAYSWACIQKKNQYGRWKTKFIVENSDRLDYEQKQTFLEKVDDLLETEEVSG